MDNKKKVEINNIINFVTNELILFEYLVSRKNIQFLLVKDYERIKYDFIREDILKQRIIIESLLKRNKTKDFLKKKESLENRFELTKQALLNDAQIKTSYYAEFLDILRNIYNEKNLFLEYDISGKRILFPVTFYKDNNEFYITNELNRNILIFDSNTYKNFDLNENETKKIIKEILKSEEKKIFINSLEIEKKTNDNKVDEIFSEIIRTSKYMIWNENNFKSFNFNESIFIVKKNLLLKDKIFEDILIEGILKNKNILLLKENGILKIKYNDFIELKNDLISIENEITKKKILKNFLSNQIGESLNESYLVQKIQEQKNNEIYKKNQVISQLTYYEIKDELENINDKDLVSFCNFIKLKCDTNFLNEVVFENEEKFNYTKNLIVKFKKENEIIKKENEQYYNNIILAIHEKKDFLNKNDLIKISKLINTQDKEEKIKKNVIAKIFDSMNTKKQEIILEKEEKCLNDITNLYKRIAKNLKELKELNQNIFICIVKVLLTENFNIQIDNILNDINKINLKRLYSEKIKTWSSNKYLLIDYLITNNQTKESILNFKLFELIEEKNEELKIKNILKTDLDLNIEKESILEKIKNKISNIQVDNNKDDNEYNIILTSKINFKKNFNLINLIDINKKFIIVEEENIN